MTDLRSGSDLGQSQGWNQVSDPDVHHTMTWPLLFLPGIREKSWKGD